MTEETLKIANRINNDIKTLEGALKELKQPHAVITVRGNDDIDLSTDLEEDVEKLIKDRIFVLKTELAVL